jgi:DNA primase
MNNEHSAQKADRGPTSGLDHVERATEKRRAVSTDNYDNYDKSYFDQRPSYRADENDNTQLARNIWDRAGPIKGTEAEKYLHHRRIRGSCVDPLAYARLRADGSSHHCLVARVQNAAGETCAINRTFLSRDGMSKADIEAPRRSLGSLSGGAVRLGQVRDQVILCEGLEDGLTLHEWLGIPVWVALGTSNLAKIKLPLTVNSVIVAQDNDQAGAAAAEETAKVWFERGRVSSIMRPPSGFKDFNDVVMSLPLRTGGSDIRTGEGM